MAPDLPELPEATPADQVLGGVLREYLAVTGRLQQTHAALQGEVERLRQELASKDRELEVRRRLAALGELAAGVAHEVRNPLGAIRLYSDLLRDQCRALKLDPALQLLEKIDAGIQAIDAVVQDTLALVPGDRQIGVCCVRTVIELARDAARGVLTSRSVRLQVRYEDPDVCVQADEHGLQRVLVNLIVNAAEASPPNGVVALEIASGSAQEVDLRVGDQGGGLSDEIRHRIFDPFFTTKPRGTGLGLTLAHRLIEAYGGRLNAGNRPAGGAEFVITLSRGAASQAGAEVEAAASRFNAA